MSKVSLPFLKKKGDKPKGKTGRGKNKKHEVSFTSEDQVEIITNDADEDTPNTQLDDKNDKGVNLGKRTHAVNVFNHCTLKDVKTAACSVQISEVRADAVGKIVLDGFCGATHNQRKSIKFLHVI